jgi:ABC-type sugar transport system ATPase subunit
MVSEPEPLTQLPNVSSAIEQPPALELQAISKSFFTTTVLNQVSFCVPAGNTLGLVGENGAGKSTLMNILGGNLQPDGGTLRLHGEPYAPTSPMEARQRGVAFVHQELNLFSRLTIAENLFLTEFPTKGGLIQRGRLNAAARPLLEKVGLSVSPDWNLDHLSAGERQLVEIARALATQPRLLIMDEPTTSLTRRETDRLFGVIEGLQSQGIAIIYISHALEDVLRLCDQIVVLRDGKVISSGPRQEYSSQRMITQMVGRSIEQLFPARRTPPKTEVRLEVANLLQPGIIRDISFQVRVGEIVGVSGLMGSGRSELARIIYGLDPLRSGEIRLDGQRIERLAPRARLQRGIAMLTESRREDGLCPAASIADNFLLASFPRFAHRKTGWLRQKPMEQAIAELRHSVRLSPSARDSQAVQTLSGGNQQKVVLGRWLLTRPKLLILDEPTRGIDIGAKADLYQLIIDLTEQGTSVLIISSELEELLGICDRLLVMNRGAIRGELLRSEFDREQILRAALHQTNLITEAG